MTDFTFLLVEVLSRVQGILDNDFYIGTLRQGKYTRKKINGKDVRRDELDHIVTSVSPLKYFAV